jgi:hypothetical protein
MGFDNFRFLVAEESIMSTSRKILFFINNFQIGGAHLQMVYLIEELKKKRI